MTVRIGVTLNWEARREGEPRERGPWKFTLNSGYSDFLRGTGAVPLGILPLPGLPPREWVRAVHGLVMTGGGDPSPALFGEPDRGSRDPETHRPLWEMELYREARKAGIPVFGICLGMQLIAVSGGCPLIQDIPTLLPGALDHERGTHPVRIVPGSCLHGLLGKTATVSSVHHQAVAAVPPGFRETARSADGVLEAMESDDGQVVAVQWHPERDATGGTLARAFVEKAEKRG